MRSVQSTFTHLISIEYYNIQNGNKFMCHSLNDAYNARIISYDEFRAAKIAIKDYMKGSDAISLITALDRGLKKVGSTYEDCLKIYQDWDNRPKLNFGTKTN